MFDRIKTSRNRTPAGGGAEEGELRFVPEQTRVVRITRETFEEMLRRGVALRGVMVGPDLFRISVPAHFEVAPARRRAAVAG